MLAKNFIKLKTPTSSSISNNTASNVGLADITPINTITNSAKKMNSSKIAAIVIMHYTSLLFSLQFYYRRI